MVRNTTLQTKLWAAAIWTLVGFFILNLFAMIGTVVTSSFATRWLGTWLPVGWTTRWYTSAWNEFQLGDVLSVTFQIVFLVVLFSGLIGVPAVLVGSTAAAFLSTPYRQHSAARLSRATSRSGSPASRVTRARKT